MNPLRSLRRFWTSPVHHTDEAIALFGRFARRYELNYLEVHDLETHGPIEVLWEFPMQPGLDFPLTLGLQNRDELNFGVPGFWSYFFPFPDVTQIFEGHLDAWLTGRARIARRHIFLQLASPSVLEVRKDGEWQATYRAFGNNWPHATDVIQNSTNAKV